MRCAAALWTTRNGFIAQCRLRNAWRVYEAMADAARDSEALLNGAILCGRAGKAHRAHPVFADVERRSEIASNLNSWRAQRLHGALITAFGNCDDLSAALQNLERIQRGDVATMRGHTNPSAFTSRRSSHARICTETTTLSAMNWRRCGRGWLGSVV